MDVAPRPFLFSDVFFTAGKEVYDSGDSDTRYEAAVVLRLETMEAAVFPLHYVRQTLLLF